MSRTKDAKAAETIRLEDWLKLAPWIVVILVALVLAWWGVSHLVDLVLGETRELAKAAPGQEVGWRAGDLVFLGFEAVGLLYIAAKWIFWRRREVPARVARNLTKEELARRTAENRHPALTFAGWGEVAILMLVLAPSVALSYSYAHSQRPAYEDARQDLVDLAKSCPALRPELERMISKGVPTMQETASMRVRAKVISKAPVRGQECRA